MEGLVELVACVGSEADGVGGGSGGLDFEVGLVLEQLTVAEYGAGAADGGRRGDSDGGSFSGGERDVVSVLADMATAREGTVGVSGGGCVTCSTGRSGV